MPRTAEDIRAEFRDCSFDLQFMMIQLCQKYPDFDKDIPLLTQDEVSDIWNTGNYAEREVTFYQALCDAIWKKKDLNRNKRTR